MWVDSEDFPVSFQVPGSWVVDRSGESEGRIIAVAPQGLSVKFSANVVTLQEHSGVESEDGLSYQDLLDLEGDKEQVFRSEFDGYRLIFLGGCSLGGGLGMKRLAFHYKNGLPITLHQFIAQRPVDSVSVTFSYPTMEAPVWQPRVDLSMAEAIWRGGGQ